MRQVGISRALPGDDATDQRHDLEEVELERGPNTGVRGSVISRQTTRPPGLTTRRCSANARRISTTLRIMKPEVAASKLLSAKGRASASASAKGKESVAGFASAPHHHLPRQVDAGHVQAQVALERLVADISRASSHVEQPAVARQVAKPDDRRRQIWSRPKVIKRFIRS